MQTFLPYSDFMRSAAALDYRRLGKQRVEAKQILTALTAGGGWRNHPATKMWYGYEDALALYHNVMIEEWVRRGYKNTMPLLNYNPFFKLPPWFGDEAFHLAHQSNLIRKDPTYYAPLFPGVPSNLPYIWPTT